MVERVDSVGALVERLGGPTATGKFFGTTPQNVVNWRRGKIIPARFYRVHQARLAAVGIEASDDLWDFVTEEELLEPPPRAEGARAGDPAP